MEVPGSNTSNGVQLQIAGCDASNINHQFHKNSSIFSVRLNGNQVIDASDTNSGDSIVPLEYHGGDNQKWRGGLN